MSVKSETVNPTKKTEREMAEEKQHKEMVKRGRGRPRKIAPSDTLGRKMVKPDEDQFPEFYKVYLVEIYSERVRIPPDFIKNFGGTVPEIVTLKSDSGISSFEADVNKIDDSWYLENGWPEFVKENSVTEGDFMTFSYAGNSVFHVKIFAINGCIKGVCDVSDDVEASDQSAEYPENIRSAERNLSPSRMAFGRESKCGNGWFSVVLKKGCFTQGWLHIPSEFWRANLGVVGKRGARTVTLWMKQKSWNMYLATLKNRVTFNNGWNKFAKDNFLGIGDLCTFRLIDDSRDLAFDVTVGP